MTRRVPILVLVSALTAAVIAATAILVHHEHTSTAGTPRPVALDEKANGRTIHVAAGATIDVVLHSTYWTYLQPEGGGVRQADRTPDVAPGTGCVPGAGCGTVTATYVALAAGTAEIRATRTSCGEAMVCRPDQANFAVTIVVGDGQAPTASTS